MDENEEQTVPDPDAAMGTVRSFTGAMEAEIARGRLEDAGIEAYLRDHHTVEIQPYLSPALGGIRLDVPVADLQRAAEVLGPLGAPEAGATHPNEVVFRVRHTRAAPGLASGAALGFALGLVGVALGKSPTISGSVFAFLSLIGWAMGRGRRADYCSEPDCCAALPDGAAVCPGCSGVIRGEIADARERLQAREALDPSTPN